MLENIVFIEKIVKKHSNLISYKGYIDFYCQLPPSPQNDHASAIMIPAVFSENTGFYYASISSLLLGAPFYYTSISSLSLGASFWYIFVISVALSPSSLHTKMHAQPLEEVPQGK